MANPIDTHPTKDIIPVVSLIFLFFFTDTPFLCFIFALYGRGACSAVGTALKPSLLHFVIVYYTINRRKSQYIFFLINFYATILKYEKITVKR